MKETVVKYQTRVAWSKTGNNLIIERYNKAITIIIFPRNLITPNSKLSTSSLWERGRTTTTTISTAVERLDRQAYKTTNSTDIQWEGDGGASSRVRLGCATMVVGAYLCMCVHGYVSPMRGFFYCCSPFHSSTLSLLPLKVPAWL